MPSQPNPPASKLTRALVYLALLALALIFVLFVVAGVQLGSQGQWSAGYWKYAGGLAVFLAIAAVVLRDGSGRERQRRRRSGRSSYAEYR